MAKLTLLCRDQYDLPKTMSFHKQKSVDMSVRLSRSHGSFKALTISLVLPQRGGHVAIRADSTLTLPSTATLDAI